MSFADLVDIVIAFFFIIVMIFSALWTYFFSLLGLSNFIDKYGKLWGFVGGLFWCLLVAAHFFVAYAFWSSSEGIVSCLVFLFLCHLFFGFAFTRNLSAGDFR